MCGNLISFFFDLLVKFAHTQGVICVCVEKQYTKTAHYLVQDMLFNSCDNPTVNKPKQKKGKVSSKSHNCYVKIKSLNTERGKKIMYKRMAKQLPSPTMGIFKYMQHHWQTFTRRVLVSSSPMQITPSHEVEFEFIAQEENKTRGFYKLVMLLQPYLPDICTFNNKNENGSIPIEDEHGPFFEAVNNLQKQINVCFAIVHSKVTDSFSFCSEWTLCYPNGIVLNLEALENVSLISSSSRRNNNKKKSKQTQTSNDKMPLKRKTTPTLKQAIGVDTLDADMRIHNVQSFFCVKLLADWKYKLTLKYADGNINTTTSPPHHPFFVQMLEFSNAQFMITDSSKQKTPSSLSLSSENDSNVLRNDSDNNKNDCTNDERKIASDTNTTKERPVFITVITPHSSPTQPRRNKRRSPPNFCKQHYTNKKQSRTHAVDSRKRRKCNQQHLHSAPDNLIEENDDSYNLFWITNSEFSNNTLPDDDIESFLKQEAIEMNA